MKEPELSQVAATGRYAHAPRDFPSKLRHATYVVTPSGGTGIRV